jgi:general secretion pathway protein C
MQAPGILYPTMDLATVIFQWKERPLSQWVSAGNRVLPPAAGAVLVVAIAFQLAKLTWLAVPSTRIDTELPTLAAYSGQRPPAAAAPSLDVAALVDAHLFGEATATPPPVVDTPVDAPDTTLSLQLTGVVARPDEKSGWAIIAASRSDAKTYVVGDEIETTNGTTLHAVYEDRVILNRAGRLEALRLPKELLASTAGRMAPPPPMEQQFDSSLRDVISENAARLTDVIRVAPYIDQGQMLGFRVNPAQDRALFEALGLQPNDVVTDINGTPLTDPSSGLQVFQSLGEATMANVTVIRNGNPEVLVIDTTQLQQLSEGRQ